MSAIITDLEQPIRLHNLYEVECFDRRGRLKWREVIKNLVTTEGLNDLLDKYLKGAAYTAAWYVGLIDNASFTSIQAGDTAAKINLVANPPTTNSWQEADDYSESVRQTLTLGTPSAGSVDNSASKASFSINGTVTLNGAFIGSSNVKGGTAGVLYGAASFGATRSVISGDTLNVTATLTAASA